MTSGPVFLGHLLVFGVAAVACFASVGRARDVGDPDTRRGLVALLLASGGWASAHVLFLAVPTPQLKTAFYQVGLVVGLGAVGPWLYFCSAYTGRSLHKNPTVRRVAVGVFLAFVAVKLTNPWHGLYFSAELVAAPFPHLAVENHLLHWLAMGLSYALAAVGYFMLLELFVRVDYDTRPIGALVAVTGLPIVLDVVGLTSPYLLDITYEPVGVAVFAVGVCFLYLDRLRAVQLTTGRENPAIVVSEASRIRDYNASAAGLFPDGLGSDAIGERLEFALPAVSEALESERGIFDRDRDGTTRHYQVTTNPFGADDAGTGRLILFADVTDRERYREELERQNERLEGFASMVSHDLRNPLNVAQAHLELARDERDSHDLVAVAEAHDRIEELIADLLALARQGQPIDETEPVGLAEVAERSWRAVETDAAELVVDGDLTFAADPDRVRQLLENLFRNAVEHGSTGPASDSRQDAMEHGSTSSRSGTDDAVEHGSTSPDSDSRRDAAGHGGADVTVRVGTLADRAGFYVADDGRGIPEEDRTQVFESGFTTARDGTGFGLAIVSEIVDAHGWEIDVTEADGGGTRFEIAGVAVGDES